MNATLTPLPVETTVGDYFVAVYPPFSAWDSAQVPALPAALASSASAAPLGSNIAKPSVLVPAGA